jgi:lipopolysaccharide transport system permease protein
VSTASTARPGTGTPSGAELLWTLVERQLRLRSKRSILGLVWPVISPLFLLALYSFVFGRVFAVPVEHYPAFLFAGLLPWTFLVQSLHDSLQSISFEPDLVRRAPFRYHYLPLARVVVMAIPAALLLVGYCTYLAVAHDLRLDLLPLLVLPVTAVALVVAALSTVVALLDVFNRDLRFVLHNLLTVWFFLVPIVYRPEMVGGELAWLRHVDPMHLVVEQFRDILYWGRAPAAGRLLLGLGLAVALFTACRLVFARLAPDLPKEV